MPPFLLRHPERHRRPLSRHAPPANVGAEAPLLQSSTVTSHGIRSGRLRLELLSEPDENSLGTPDVAESIHVFILDHFADTLRAAFAEPGERIVDVLHGEHDAQVAERVHWGVAMISDHGRREETRHLEPAVTVRRTHHGNLDAHVAQSSHAICPLSLDWSAPLELETKLGEELNGGINVFHHDADVVHTLDRHDVSWASNVEDQPPADGSLAFRLERSNPPVGCIL